MSVASYPLQWPHGRARRPVYARKTGRFLSAGAELTVAAALTRLQGEIDRIDGRYPVVSTNLEPRLDGLPRAGQREPADPGVAVYFQLAGKPICMPCDTYTRVSQNIAAVAAHIEATRAIERHGVASVAEMFAGFVALPKPKSHWEVLDLQPGSSVDAIEFQFRNKAKALHPDTGGSTAAMSELNAARDAALREIGGS